MDGGLVLLLIVLAVCGTALYSAISSERAAKHQALLADTRDSMKLQLEHEERMAQLRNEELQLRVRLVEAERPKAIEAPKK